MAQPGDDVSTNVLVQQPVLVTGATGFLGGALVHRLVAEGAIVYALVRNPQRAGYIQHLENVVLVTGDITDASRMQTIISNYNVAYIFHVAAALEGTYAHQHRVNVTGTENIVTAAATVPTMKRIIYVSSIAVYGYTCPNTVTEDTPHRPGNVPYNRTKSQAEARLIDMLSDSDLSYSIIRPGMIFGPRSHAWTEQLFSLSKVNPTPFVGEGHGTCYPIYVDDVVDMMIVLATHSAALNNAFNCVLDPPPTWREFIGQYSHIAGHNNWLALPPWICEGAAYLIEWVLKWRKQPQDAPLLIPFITGCQRYSMYKAANLLTWKPRITLDDGISRTLPYLRKKGLL